LPVRIIMQISLSLAGEIFFFVVTNYFFLSEKVG
jgi:hypothetical protein